MRDAAPASAVPLQVLATLPALQLIDTLRARHGPVLFHQCGGCCDGSSPMCYPQIDTLRARHGPVLFHQSGGCCDGSSPMCYPQDEFIVGDRDVQLGEIGGAPFSISAPQFEYWKHTQLIADVVPGRGGMFSLENGEGVRFMVRSRLFGDAEHAALQAAGKV